MFPRMDSDNVTLLGFFIGFGAIFLFSGVGSVLHLAKAPEKIHNKDESETELTGRT